MTHGGNASRLLRALRRAVKMSYWRRELATARVLKPAYFTLMLRWFTWLLALLLVVTGVLLPGNMTYALALLALTGLWLLVQSLYLPVLRAGLPPALRRYGLVRDGVIRLIDEGRVWGVVEVVLAGLVIFLTGGWGSPFFMYGLATVVLPSLLFGYRAALAAGAGFTALFALAVVANPIGYAYAIMPGTVDRFIAYLFVPIPFALFAAYLGQVMRQVEAERDRSRQALAEARVLAAVTTSGLRHVAHPERFVAETVTQVRRRLRLQAFAIVYHRPRPERDGGGPHETDGEDVSGFGPIHGLVAALRRGEPLPASQWRVVCLRLGQAGRDLGLLVAQVDDGDSRRPFLTQLAGQVSAALANAQLYAEAEELAAQAERARLAREIHDGIAQSLFMLTLNLEACAELAERDPALLKERLEMLIGLARQTLWQARHYIHDLKPLLDQEQGLRHAIENQIKEFRTVSGLTVDLTVAGDEVEAAPAIKQALYRIVQEGLSNVFKHAGARQVTVALAFDAAGARLTIEDDGRGFVPEEVDGSAGRGFGLGNMRERAAELGGRFTIVSEPGQGARLAVWVPYRVPARVAVRERT